MNILRAFRQKLISAPMMRNMAARLPKISATEAVALDAGKVWWEGELFSGKPNIDTLLNYPKAQLSDAETAFIDGPVTTLCTMLDDWQITHEQGEIPQNIWTYMKQQGFFGLIIPKQYGGLDFSAEAHSRIVMMVSSRSFSAAVTVMVPSSLGPSKLLLEYGTDAQRQHYLPRLARGKDIPCFALTGPEAGSDANAIPDTGIVCSRRIKGETVIGIRLNWNKRYITLAPVATLLGLAFKLHDPSRLLGGKQNLGITVALIPTHTKGVEIGRRHYPLNAAFPNGPTQGRNVFIPIDHIIGGAKCAGQGWRMLVESLADGRGISLPALATGGAKLALLSSSAYSIIRRQFKQPIGHFEGVREALAKMTEETYILEALRSFTTAALDAGEKPSVCTAIAKYQSTERMRKVIDHAMDIHAGKGICMGPNNGLARIYQAVPIGITVEGANILTRTLITFGQGAIRAHPHLLTELHAAQNQDLDGFDRALGRHIRWTLANSIRTPLRAVFPQSILQNKARLALTHLSSQSPSDADRPIQQEPQSAPYNVQLAQLMRWSAAFALVSDFTLLSLGGQLKRKERLSGRLADVLSNLYLVSALVRHFEANPHTHAVFVASTQNLFYDIEQNLSQIITNLPSRPISLLLRVLVFPLGKSEKPVKDDLSELIAEQIINNGETREFLTEGIYKTQDPNDPLGRIEHAYQLTVASTKLEHRIRRGDDLNKKQHQQLARAAQARRDAIAVDDFPHDFLHNKRQDPTKQSRSHNLGNVS